MSATHCSDIHKQAIQRALVRMDEEYQANTRSADRVSHSQTALYKSGMAAGVALACSILREEAKKAAKSA